jgi:hypothetical protein
MTSTVTAHAIVDASVARSASDPARVPVTEACLLVARLLESRECLTGAVMTPALQSEWKKHASRLMSAWLVSMEQRGRVRREKDRRVADLRAAIESVPDGGVRAALAKDLHLSEAAIMHRVPVLSLDDKQRRFLRDLGQTYAPAARLQWVNPVSDDSEAWSAWLRAGCADAEVFRASAA